MVGLIPALVVVGSPLGEPLFAQFMKQFVQDGDERYASAEGRRTRRAAFDANVRKVRELNARDPHATYSAMVPWADLTEAFRRIDKKGEGVATLATPSTL